MILLNTYREAVRARVLHGLFALSLGTCLYSLVVGEYTSKNALRVVSDVGSFAVSIYGIIVAIVLGATGLYRELELKTVFPILARPLHRGQYLLGKYFGTLFTLAVFMAANSAVLLLSLHGTAGGSWSLVAGVILGSALIALVVARRFPESGIYIPVLWALGVAALGYWLASEAPDDRRVVVVAATLALLEVMIVTAVATVFSSFSSPFLTAVFTFGVFLVGRSADTLAKLPPKIFGETIHQAGVVLSQLFPNLMVYVPPRPLLTGEAGDVGLFEYLGLAATQSCLWSAGLLLLAARIFHRRDFV